MYVKRKLHLLTFPFNELHLKRELHNLKVRLESTYFIEAGVGDDPHEKAVNMAALLRGQESLEAERIIWKFREAISR